MHYLCLIICNLHEALNCLQNIIFTTTFFYFSIFITYTAIIILITIMCKGISIYARISLYDNICQIYIYI